MNIKDLVKGKFVVFDHYRAGFLHYVVEGTDFYFTVPVSDCGEATFPAREKAMLFMRYIRQQLENLKD